MNYNRSAEIESCKIEQQWKERAKEMLLEPLISAESENLAATSDEKKERSEKILEIMSALQNGCNEIVCFEILQFKSSIPCGDSAKAKVTLMLCKTVNNELEEIVLLDKKLGTKCIPNENVILQKLSTTDCRAAFLVAEVEAFTTGGRRPETGQKTSPTKYYGVKQIGSNKSGEFRFVWKNSGISLITANHESLRSSRCKPGDAGKWKRNPTMLEDIWKKTKDLSTTSDVPFVAYEMSDLHGSEDWDAIDKRLKQVAPFKKLIRGKPTVTFVTAGNVEKTLATSSFGLCPLTLRKYGNLKDHLAFLNQRFDDMEFTNMNRNQQQTVQVNLAHKKKQPPIVKQPQKEVTSVFKKEEWTDGIIDQSFLATQIKYVPVPYRTGPNGEGNWVKVEYSNEEKKALEIRRIRNCSNLTEDAKELAILLNCFIIDYESRDGPKSVGDKIMKFFDEKFDDIMKIKQGLNIIYLASHLFQREILTADENAAVFDRYSEALLEEQEKEKQAKNGPTCSMNKTG